MSQRRSEDRDIGALLAAGPPRPTPTRTTAPEAVTKGTPAFEKRTVSLVDRFEQPRVFEVVKPAQLCAPADRNGEAPVAPAHPGHLLCYEVRTVHGEPKLEKVLGVHLDNQIAPGRVDVRREHELCVPSQATP